MPMVNTSAILMLAGLGFGVVSTLFLYFFPPDCGQDLPTLYLGGGIAMFISGLVVYLNKKDGQH
jgi:hypothetical protein